MLRSTDGVKLTLYTKLYKVAKKLLLSSFYP